MDKKKKWFKLRYGLLADDPLFSLVGILFESLKIEIDGDRLKTLPKATQFLFEEIVPKKLTAKEKSVIN